MDEHTIIALASSVGVREHGPNSRNWSFELSQLLAFVELVRKQPVTVQSKVELNSGWYPPDDGRGAWTEFVPGSGVPKELHLGDTFNYLTRDERSDGLYRAVDVVFKVGNRHYFEEAEADDYGPDIVAYRIVSKGDSVSPRRKR